MIFGKRKNKLLTGGGTSGSSPASPDLRLTPMNLTNSDLLRILALLTFSEEDTPSNFYQALGLTLLLRTLPADEPCVAHHFREVQELLRAFNPSPVE